MKSISKEGIDIKLRMRIEEDIDKQVESLLSELEKSDKFIHNPMYIGDDSHGHQ